jgi:hypothetical protein
MKKTLTLFLSAFLMSGLCAGSGKLARELESLDPAANVDVIVQFKQAPTAVQHQKVISRGGVHKKSLDVIKGALYSMPAAKLKELSEDPEVAYISPDRLLPGGDERPYRSEPRLDRARRRYRGDR